MLRRKFVLMLSGFFVMMVYMLVCVPVFAKESLPRGPTLTVGKKGPVLEEDRPVYDGTTVEKLDASAVHETIEVAHWTLNEKATVVLQRDGSLSFSGDFSDVLFTDVSEVPWHGDDRIKTVVFSNTMNAANLDFWFQDCPNLQAIEGIIPDSVQSMRYTFAYCPNLITLGSDFSVPDTLSGMFVEFAFYAHPASMIPMSLASTDETVMNWDWSSWNRKRNGAITFILNDGIPSSTVVLPDTYPLGRGIDLDAFSATKEGRVFSGWYLDEACTQKVSVISASCVDDITVYAKFKKETDGIVRKKGRGVEPYVSRYKVMPGNSRVDIYVQVENSWMIDTLKFPTWTDSGGQDDLVWYSFSARSQIDATIDGERYNYCFSMDRNGNHRYDYGTYATHMYGYWGGGDHSMAAFPTYMMGTKTGYHVEEWGDGCGNWVCSSAPTYGFYVGQTNDTMTHPYTGDTMWCGWCGTCLRGGIYATFRTEWQSWFTTCAHYNWHEIGYKVDGQCNRNGGWARNGYVGNCGGNFDHWQALCTDHVVANPYNIVYDGNGADGGSTGNSRATYDQNSGVSANGFTKTGHSFIGWSLTPEGKTICGDGGTVLNLSSDYNGTVTLYAKWAPNTYTLTYAKRNPTGASANERDIVLSAPNKQAKYNSVWGALSTATKPGYLFTGWLTSDGKAVTKDTVCKGDLTVYTQWKPITYRIRFHPNAENGAGTVTGTMSDVMFTYDKAQTLPQNQYTKTVITPAEEEGGEIRQTPAVFKGWNAVPEGLTPSHKDQAKILNLTVRHDDTINLYAIWDDAPTFIVDSYPDRFFTIEEAQSGIITEEELLRTVVVYDRETNPLPKKDAQDVIDSGNDMGITVVDYSFDDFTSVTDDTTISIRYKVKDTSGNETFLSISVSITRNGNLPETARTYYRSISNAYADKAADAGGLANDSYWRKQTPEEANEYAELLQQAIGDSPAKSYDLLLGKKHLADIRKHVAENGFGTATDPNGLNDVWTILGE